MKERKRRKHKDQAGLHEPLADVSVKEKKHKEKKEKKHRDARQEQMQMNNEERKAKSKVVLVAAAKRDRPRRREAAAELEEDLDVLLEAAVENDAGADPTEERRRKRRRRRVEGAEDNAIPGVAPGTWIGASSRHGSFSRRDQWLVSDYPGTRPLPEGWRGSCPVPNVR